MQEKQREKRHDELFNEIKPMTMPKQEPTDDGETTMLGGQTIPTSDLAVRPRLLVVRPSKPRKRMA
jgi:hypothetical protein